jgi:hypothetical protein
LVKPGYLARLYFFIPGPFIIFAKKEEMPEGPEVRRMAEGLAKRIVGKELIEAEILGGKWLKKEPTGIEIIREVIRIRTAPSGMG